MGLGVCKEEKEKGLNRGGRIKDKVDGVAAAWTEAGKGWIGMYIHHHIRLQCWGMESIVVGVDTGEIWRDRGGSAVEKEEG